MIDFRDIKTRKPCVFGKNLVFRNAEKFDALFILSLRTDENKSRYLSTVHNDRGAQEDWLNFYQSDSEQLYFIIELQGVPIGTVRIYDAVADSFCWGSWILSDEAPSYAAIESALMLYLYSIDHLGFNSAHFDVRKANTKVWKFHERFGAIRICESEIDFYYQIDRATILNAHQRYKRYLPAGIRVDF